MCRMLILDSNQKGISENSTARVGVLLEMDAMQCIWGMEE